MSKRLELVWPEKDKVLLGLNENGKPIWGTKADLETRLLVQLEAIGETNPDNLNDLYEQGDNLLIKGDNLLALKALERHFANKIKCIYIDPPFNTGNAFEYYDDGLEHTIWLSLMKARLEILKTLLSINGVLYVHIDDVEFAYLKVVLDEVFGRANFISQIAWERSAVAGLGLRGSIINVTEYILCYARNKHLFAINEKYRAKKDLPIEKLKGYSSILQDEGRSELVDEFTAKSTGLPVKIFQHADYTIERISFRSMYQQYSEIMSQYRSNFNRIFRSFLIQQENQFQHEIIDRTGEGLYSVEYTPSRGKSKGALHTIYYLNGELVGWLRDNALLTEEGIIKNERVNDFWTKEDISNAARGEGGIRGFDRSKKPEELLQRIIEMSTESGDWVLDSFLGSGTTAAVAHKLGRKWIGVEIGEHAETLCLPRLKRVVSGDDQTGISKQVGWKGGGGFRYCVLGESLFAKDKDTGLVMFNPRYTNGPLVAAVCNLEDFHLNDDSVFQGMRGNSYAHITEDKVTQAYLDALVEKLPKGKNLVVYCLKRATGLGVPEEVRVKRIPKELQIPRYLTNGGRRGRE